MKEIKFINSYSFTYSPRPGTPAADLKLIDDNIAKERLSIFQEIAKNIKQNYRKNLINKKVKVLFENKLKDDSKYFGRDEYFNSVVVDSSINLVGKTIDVGIEKINHNTLFGKVILKERKEFAA